MDALPVGYLVFLSVMTVSALAAYVAPGRPRWVGVTAAVLATVSNELSLAAFLLLGFSTWQAVIADQLLTTPVGCVLFAVAVGIELVFLLLLVRGLRARAVVAHALTEAFGGVHEARGTRPVWQTLLTPLPVRPRTVQRIGNLSYGPGGRRNLLDVYRHRSAPAGAPVLVYLHGGGYFSGSKRREARALLHRFASRGWVCVAATYRLRPQVQFPDHLIGAKRVLAWVREHGAKNGRRPVGDRVGRQLGRRGHGGACGADPERPGVPTRVRGRRHHREGGRVPARLLRALLRPRQARAALVLAAAARRRPARHRSSSRMATATPTSRCCRRRRWCASCGQNRPHRWCTRDCPAASTASTWSGHRGSTRSSPVSRPSPPTQ